MLLPVPHWPFVFAPQQYAVPSSSRAHVCQRASPIPIDTESALPGSVTCVGLGLAPPVVPSPMLPKVLSPQHQTEPSVRTAHVCTLPAATSMGSLHFESTQPTEQVVLHAPQFILSDD